MTDQQHPYYIGHFWAVIDGIERRYAALLNAREHSHIAALRALPPCGLRLYVRLANRKGPCFRETKLRYADLDVALALQALSEAGLLAAATADDAAVMLACFTCDELRVALKTHQAAKQGGRLKLIDWILQHEKRPAMLGELLQQDMIVMLAPGDPWDFFRFLFFGHRADNLADFVIRELGHVVTEQQNEHALAPLFCDRVEADHCYAMAKTYEAFRARRSRDTAEMLLAWWQSLRLARQDFSEKAWPLFDRLVQRLGALLEKDRQLEAALQVYIESPAPPCTERRVRLMLKLGQSDGALALCQTKLQTPQDDGEAYALRQLLARMQKTSRRSEARSLLKTTEAIALLQGQSNVEQALLHHYDGMGWNGVHAENGIWNALFGLAFWDIIYDPRYGSFHHPLQFAPSDLNTPSFYEKRAAAFEERLRLFDDARAMRDFTQAQAALKHGTANPFVGWHDDLDMMIGTMLDHVPGSCLAAVMRHLAKDVKNRRRGFPDLFIWREGTEKTYCFVEVKSPSDQLQPGQYQWLRFFESIGLHARVQPVVWIAPERERSADMANGVVNKCRSA